MRKNSTKAPWGLDSSSSSVGSVASYKPVTLKSPWVHGSSVLREEEARRQSQPEYQMKTPWEVTSQDLAEQHDDMMKAEEHITRRAVWEEDSKYVPETAGASDYKFKCLHTPEPMSEKKVKQVAEYAYDPPYQTEFTPIEEKVLKPRKVDKTIAPWKHGEFPSVGSGAKGRMHPTADTSLWSRPPPVSNTAELLCPSGDPVLDKLRFRLQQTGASGIFGLSRKFRIMVRISWHLFYYFR